MKKLIILMFMAAMFNVTSCKDDPCENTICENGYCQNGSCECDDGFNGAACDKQITPNLIKINKITITNFPLLKPDTSSWDTGSSADLILIIAKGNSLNSPIIYQSADYNTENDVILNAVNQNYTIIPHTPIEIDSPNSIYSVFLIDYDDIGYDMELMSWDNNFVPYNNTNGFPTVLYGGNSVFSYNFDVTYLW